MKVKFYLIKSPLNLYTCNAKLIDLSYIIETGNRERSLKKLNQLPFFACQSLKYCRLGCYRREKVNPAVPKDSFALLSELQKYTIRT